MMDFVIRLILIAKPILSQESVCNVNLDIILKFLKKEKSANRKNSDATMLMEDVYLVEPHSITILKKKLVKLMDA